MPDIRVNDHYLLRIHHTSEEACVGEIVHITRENAVTITEAIGRVVRQFRGYGSELPDHLLPGTIYLIGHNTHPRQKQIGNPMWKVFRTTRIFVCNDICRVLLAESILTNPSVFWVHDYSPVRDITVGTIYDDD